MNKKTSLILLASFVSFTLAFQGVFSLFSAQREKLDARQTSIIQEDIRERFQLFLNLPLSVGYIGSDFLGKQKTLLEQYGSCAENLIKHGNDILGLSLMDEQGKIIGVYPEKDNPATVGKISQNLKFLRESLKKKEAFWFSPPFNLYQGQKGFAFYVPIYNADKFRGWFAPVISAPRFFKEFKLAEFLKSFDLIIKDEATGLPYFATAMDPSKETKVYRTHATLYNRQIIFESWRKDPSIYEYPFHWSLLIALVLTLVVYLVQRLYQQKRKASDQLDDISILLRLTSKEALGHLVDLQREFHKMGGIENITYVTNLIEQIDLLQTIAHTKEGLDSERHEILPVIKAEIENLWEISSKKNLQVLCKEEDFKDVFVSANGWLLQNCVVSNILTHSIIHAQDTSTVRVDYRSTASHHVITFQTEKIIDQETEGHSIKMGRRMEVAKTLLHVYRGELFLQYDLTGGMIIRIILPL